ncbi:MAG: 3-alpha,7-alpha,12-alpha-trihydroxy-5-beta-cholest-24-enoyl-CoA hydratase [Rhodospirillaceae bacterium]|nr:3-alpha,7-alpha,12-alpha-trihydroxy-5-beta-cholest-24-enoyl-CoA hydratase [Rhodospirillaceae bacterium]
MSFDYHKLKNWPFKEVTQTYTTNDTILYALGIGLGADPMDERQLRYVFEESECFQALPTMAVVLGSPGFWSRDPETGIDWVKVLHGEQKLVLHNPLPTSATITAQSKVTGLVDKGAEKGALILTERTLRDSSSGQHLATLTSTTFARGDGGYGGPSDETPAPHELPNRMPDFETDLSTLERAALIYRLSGDYNPLHASPSVAKAAGFQRPILHGLCSLGVAGHAILKSCCNYEAEKLKSLQLRFSSPVYPGETIRTQIWVDGGQISFRSKVLERDVIVLNNGLATIEN